MYRESIQSVDNDINENENENKNERPLLRQFPDGRSENMNDPSNSFINVDLSLIIFLISNISHKPSLLCVQCQISQ